MLKLITVLMLNLWAIPAEDVLTPNIDIYAELGKIQVMEKRMESMENEIRQLKTENEKQAKELAALHVTMNNKNIKMDELIKQNEDFLKNSKTQIEELITDNQGREIAFSASLVKSGAKHFGPFPTDTTLIYENVLTNIGNAYNQYTGVFTAPRRGVYMFKIYVYGLANEKNPSTCVIVKNGQLMVLAHAHRLQLTVNSSNGVLLLLEVGDVVYVRLQGSRTLYDNENNHNTFSGYLLFPLKEQKSV